MIAQCQEFVLMRAPLLPAAILSEIYEQPHYDAYKIKGRIVITADDDNKFPDLMQEALKRGLISEAAYKAEQERLWKNHGIKI